MQEDAKLNRKLFEKKKKKLIKSVEWLNLVIIKTK